MKKHPSYGYARPDEIAKLSGDISQFEKNLILSRIAARVPKKPRSNRRQKRR